MHLVTLPHTRIPSANMDIAISKSSRHFTDAKILLIFVTTV